MKQQRFSTEQIMSVLKQAELGLLVADLIRQIGISEETFYRWKRKYGCLESDRVRELKQIGEVIALKAFNNRSEFAFRRLALSSMRMTDRTRCN